MEGGQYEVVIMWNRSCPAVSLWIDRQTDTDRQAKEGSEGGKKEGEKQTEETEKTRVGDR